MKWQLIYLVAGLFISDIEVEESKVLQSQVKEN